MAMIDISGQRKDLALDGLRGLACMNVFLAHFLFVFFPYLAHGQSLANSRELAPSRWQEVAANFPFTVLYNGQFPVVIFFVISGYVLLKRYWSTGDRTVLLAGALKRYPRLILPAAAAGLFALILVNSGLMGTQLRPDPQFAGWLRWQYDAPIPVHRAIYEAFVGMPLFGQTTLNSPTWTLQVEVIVSIELFAVFLAFGKRKYLALLAYAVACVLIPKMALVLAFAGGVALCALASALRARPALSTTVLVAGVAVGCFDFTERFTWLQAIPLPDLSPVGFNFNSDPRSTWCTVGAVLVVAGVIGSRQAAAVLSTKALTYLGRISFSIYLLHWPIFCAIAPRSAIWLQSRGLTYGESAAATFLALLLLVLSLSHAFTLVVDEPSERLAKRFAAYGLARWNTPLFRSREPFSVS